MKQKLVEELEELDSLLKLLKEHDVTEYRFKNEDKSIQLTRGGVFQAVAAAPVAMMPAAAAAAPAAPAAPAEDPGVVTVDSPMVGTFYRSPSPDSPAFVEVGARISASQTLCIVEAMKLMNEIESEVSGTITAILVEDGQPVQFGEPLFKIKVD
jgi:acetyl-CoA carboxylase biotin carboxyl carrier protein